MILVDGDALWAEIYKLYSEEYRKKDKTIESFVRKLPHLIYRCAVSSRTPSGSTVAAEELNTVPPTFSLRCPKCEK